MKVLCTFTVRRTVRAVRECAGSGQRAGLVNIWSPSRSIEWVWKIGTGGGKLKKARQKRKQFLGWSIVKRIAAVFGAQVQVARSERLGGLAVSVRWPVQRAG